MSPPRWRGRRSFTTTTALSHQFAPDHGATSSLTVCSDSVMPALGDDEPEVIGVAALDHALPAKHLDRLRRGVPQDRLEPKTVYNAFVSVAMSAQRRGWGEGEFVGHVTSETWSTVNGHKMRHPYGLWAQLCALSRRPYQDLASAWEQAAANLRDDAMWTTEDVRSAAVETAWAWGDRLLAGVDRLDPIDAKIIDYVIVWTEKRGRSEVTCPYRDVGDHAGISKTTAHRRMRRLTARGLLILENPGHASTKKFVNGKVTLVGGKAAVYRLGSPELAPLARWDTDECPGSTYVPHGGWAE